MSFHRRSRRYPQHPGSNMFCYGVCSKLKVIVCGLKKAIRIPAVYHGL